jgi:hypothetical protein
MTFKFLVSLVHPKLPKGRPSFRLTLSNREEGRFGCRNFEG